MASKKTVSTKVIADLFGYDERRIQQLVTTDKILFAEKVNNGFQFDLYQTVRDFVAHLKLRLDGADNEAADELLMQKLQAEVDFKQAKAKTAQLELKELEGELHRSEDVELAVTDMAVNIRSLLLALPGQLAVDVCEAETPAIASAIINKSVNNLLHELSEYQYDPNVYRDKVRERKGYKKKDETKAE